MVLLSWTVDAGGIMVGDIKRIVLDGVSRVHGRQPPGSLKRQARCGGARPQAGVLEGWMRWSMMPQIWRCSYTEGVQRTGIWGAETKGDWADEPTRETKGCAREKLKRVNRKKKKTKKTKRDERQSVSGNVR